VPRSDPPHPCPLPQGEGERQPGGKQLLPCHGLFPLTPALSLRERVKGSPGENSYPVPRSVPPHPCPLPQGEGERQPGGKQLSLCHGLFPLTPALSLREREKGSPGENRYPCATVCSLSLRERVRVRGRRKH